MLVHRKGLMNQSAKRFREYGLNCGVIHNSEPFNPALNIQVSTVQTFIKRMHTFTPDVILVDECHHAVSPTYSAICDNFLDASIIGVTATPWRANGKGLADAFDTMILGPSMEFLFEEGALVKPKYVGSERKINLEGVAIRGGDYEAAGLSTAMNKPQITGDAVKVYLSQGVGKPCIVFCTSIKHSKDVADMFKASGVRAAAVSGEDDEYYINACLTGLESGAINVVTTCDLISEGTDLPAVSIGISLRPTMSLVTFMQQVGRIMRPAEGKQAIWFDLVDNWRVHGLPWWDMGWTLEGDNRPSRKPEIADIKIRQCPKCYTVHEPSPKCANCGHVYAAETRKSQTIKQKEGELMEITEDMDLALRKHRAKEVARARTLEDLRKIEKQRGYAKGWAERIFKARNLKPITHWLSFAPPHIRQDLLKAAEGITAKTDNVNDAVLMLPENPAIPQVWEFARMRLLDWKPEGMKMESPEVWKPEPLGMIINS